MNSRKRFSKDKKRMDFLSVFIYVAIIAAAVLIIIAVGVRKNDDKPSAQDQAVSDKQKQETQIIIDPIFEKEDNVINVYDHVSEKLLEMNIDEYVFHSLAGEMFGSYEPEALKAQAVAIRTYAVYKMQHGGCQVYDADICTDYSNCLAYLRDDEFEGRWEDKAAEYEMKMRKAVSDTAGEIITYNGEPINALFHSNSGGMTEDTVNVWGNDSPYLKSVEGYESEDSFKYEQIDEFSYDEFWQKLKEAQPDIKEGLIRITKRYDSGRVEKIIVGNKTFSGIELRSIFGLNSANFDVERTKNGYSFDVHGYGHGVGLSQAGAQAMALEGSDYITILSHYYTGVEIENMDDIK